MWAGAEDIFQTKLASPGYWKTNTHTQLGLNPVRRSTWGPVGFMQGWFSSGLALEDQGGSAQQRQAQLQDISWAAAWWSMPAGSEAMTLWQCSIFVVCIREVHVIKGPFHSNCKKKTLSRLSLAASRDYCGFICPGFEMCTSEISVISQCCEHLR